MDRGYGSEAIRRLIREILHANSVIPLRSWNADFVGESTDREWPLGSMTSSTLDDNSLKTNSLS